MKIQEEENRLAIVDDKNKAIAEVTYTNVGEDLYIIDNTHVDPAYRGKGLAKKLVQTLVDKARKNGKKVLPVCPFANMEFERRNEYQDVKK
jgi:uncharacterized protein